jgi:protein involved in polysaccharide export with SLBB domain
MHFLLLSLLLGFFIPHSLQGQATSAISEAMLRPGDVIRVAVWREIDLSGDFPVDEAGRVVLPMLGETVVTGIPIPQLRDSLLAEYRRQLRNPSILITPLRRVMVLGEVNIPGLKELDPTMSLASAIALAGGPNGQGRLSRIHVVREGEVLRERVDPAMALHAIDIRSGDQIFVGRRSWFEANSTYLVSTGISMTLLLLRLF